MTISRRTVISTAAATALGAGAGSLGTYFAMRPGEQGEDVAAPEDLMREHGVLNRILLIYEEGLRRLGANQEVAADAFRQPAELVRRFVEDYHEHLEEQFIFPEFEQRQHMVELVQTLRRQHQAGRRVTDIILHNTVADQFGQPARRQELREAVLAFIRMYRPHETREDTVLFPAFRKIVSAAKIKELGDRFEEEENRRFGAEGFEHIVEQVAGMERQLGIYNLDQFTPANRGRDPQ